MATEAPVPTVAEVLRQARELAGQLSDTLDLAELLIEEDEPEGGDAPPPGEGDSAP